MSTELAGKLKKLSAASMSIVTSFFFATSPYCGVICIILRAPCGLSPKISYDLWRVSDSFE